MIARHASSFKAYSVASQHDYRVPQAGAQADVDVLVLDIDKVDKDPGHRSLVLDRAMRTRDMDNERFLRKVRERLDRCGTQKHG